MRSGDPRSVRPVRVTDGRAGASPGAPVHRPRPLAGTCASSASRHAARRRRRTGGVFPVRDALWPLRPGPGARRWPSTRPDGRRRRPGADARRAPTARSPWIGRAVVRTVGRSGPWRAGRRPDVRDAGRGVRHRHRFGRHRGRAGAGRDRSNRRPSVRTPVSLPTAAHPGLGRTLVWEARTGVSDDERRVGWGTRSRRSVRDTVRHERAARVAPRSRSTTGARPTPRDEGGAKRYLTPRSRLSG